MDKQQRELILETMETILELELRAVRQALGTDDPQTGAARLRGRKRKSLTDLSVELLTNDTTVGRAMDAVFDAGAEKVFSEVAFNASCKFS
jgi:hypothetical protein